MDTHPKNNGKNNGHPPGAAERCLLFRLRDTDMYRLRMLTGRLQKG